ncbi:MAG TPA: hypothetical protein VD902_05640 [Symbiobacteriaceae bacterium]|nr:hypothetical protein [Symbiobacteriaceae bacterium]
MNRTIALILVVLGAILLLKFMASAATILLLLALVLAIATGVGAVGRWGYGVAVLCALMALPGLVISGIFKGLAFLGILLKFFPILILIIGAYMLVRSIGK